MKCKLASPEEIEKARKLCQDLFGKIGPESGEALVGHFKEQLQTWRRQLAQFRPLAQTGQYPGASAIDRALGVIEGVLTPDELETQANRIIDALAQPFDFQGEQVTAGASIGLAQVTEGDGQVVAKHRSVGRTAGDRSGMFGASKDKEYAVR